MQAVPSPSRQQIGEQRRAEGQRQAEARRQAKSNARLREHHLTASHRLRFVHVRDEATWTTSPQPLPKGGVTVAYQLPARKGDRIIRASIAIVHENDAYNKAEGRLRAAAKFDEESIKLRVPRNMPPSMFLKQMFSAML